MQGGGCSDGGGADDHAGGQDDGGRPAPGAFFAGVAGNALEDILYHFIERLDDGGEGRCEELEVLIIVETDDGDVIGYPLFLLAQGGEAGKGEAVVCEQDGVDGLVGLEQGADGGFDLIGGGGCGQFSNIGWEAVIIDGGGVSFPAVGNALLIGADCDEGDMAVAVADEMPDGLIGSFEVVGEDGVRTGVGGIAVEEDDRFSFLQELFQIGVDSRGRCDDIACHIHIIENGYKFWHKANIIFRAAQD